jgi:TolA-binding protein
MVSITEDLSTRAEYLLLLAELSHGTQQYGKVVGVTQRILALELEDEKGEHPYYVKEKAYFLLGEAYQRMGRRDMVIATYQEGLKRYGAAYYSADMLFSLALTYFQQGTLYDAALHFERFLSKYPDNPNGIYARYYLGYALYNQSVFDRAEKVFGALGAAFPKADVASDALYRAGESAFNLGQFERTMAFYRTVFEKYPRSEQADDALYNTAWSLLELGRDQEAVGYLEQLLTEFPKSPFCPNARFTLGDYYYNRGEYEEALREYQTVLNEYPEDEVASRVPDIVDDLKETVAYLDYEQARAVFSEALAGEDTKGFEKAVVLFEGIVRKHPDTESAVGALSNMGISYEYLHRWREAVSAYDRVLVKYEAGEATPDAYRFAKTHKEWIVASRL